MVIILYKYKFNLDLDKYISPLQKLKISRYDIINFRFI
jgi:hypothetical protein